VAGFDKSIGRTFLFDTLPPGKVEAIAICDGFVKGSATPKIADFIMPQVFN
jgi:hypothetical protein